MPDTILYVDDDESNLIVFEASCGREFRVLTAASGSAALALLRCQPDIALLLADQRMPGMTGVELLEQARSEFPDVVRVLITAYSDFQDALLAINRGQVQRFLRKPWEPDELKASLREALEVHRSAQRVKGLEGRLRETERVYALGVVAAGIAHELRNPITAVATNLSLMREEIETLIKSGRAKQATDTLHELALMVAEAKEGVQLITDITRGIELTQRRRDTENQADMADVVRLTLASLRGELRQRAELHVQLDYLPDVRGSRTKLGQVVLNLVVNALQALPNRARAENRVQVKLTQHGAHARLDVEDNGCGISPADQARIFDPFYTSKVDGGMGLGLAISRRIVEELGGSIELESQLELGTRFSVFIPLAENLDTRV